MSNILLSHIGASFSYTLDGPPDNIIPLGRFSPIFPMNHCKEIFLNKLLLPLFFEQLIEYIGNQNLK